MIAKLSSLDSLQRAVLFGWTGLVVIAVVTGLVAAMLRPRWWGSDRAFGWFDIAVFVLLGFLPLLTNVWGS